MSTVTTLILIQQSITRYVLSTILAFGTLGNLIAIGIFLQKKFRTNSCSIYLVAASIFGVISANWAIAPLVYALDHFDVVNTSVVLCRIRGYIIHINSMCFRYTLALMCADRYALCSSRPSIRALCRPQIAYRSLSILTIFWIIFSVHLLIWESIENNRCSVYGLYGQIYGFYVLITTGIIPTTIMTVLSILVIKKLRQLRSRVQPLNNNNTRLNRRDMNLIKLVLVEVVVYILCTFSYPIMSVYLTTSNNIVPSKSAERRQIETFVNFFAMALLLYLNYNTTFYVHFLTSAQYRLEVKQLILKLIRRSEIEPNQEEVRQDANQTQSRRPMQITSTVRN